MGAVTLFKNGKRFCFAPSFNKRVDNNTFYHCVGPNICVEVETFFFICSLKITTYILH